VISLAATPKAANEACAFPIPIAPDVATTVSIIDPTKDLASDCTAATGELTYALTLTQTQDVKIYATTLEGSGSPVIGLRSPHCTDAADELECNASSLLALFKRALPPATYVITVAATAPIDANLLVELSPPSIAPPDQTCASPPLAMINKTMDVDLSNHEQAIRDGCLPGAPTAAYDVPLAAASDVLVVGRFPQVEEGAVSFDATACTMATNLACESAGTPVRVGRRGVPVGDYRVVIADQIGSPSTTLTTLVRDAVPPTIVTGADVCASAIDIPDGGGFFTGDTSTANPDYDNGCNATNLPPGGAPDQVLRLDLTTATTAKRVVLDMEGSTYTTILDVYEGPACPGTPIDNGCYVGFTSSRSFLDVTLSPGQYWIVIDGYAGGAGAWNLDVRVIDP
jgi:hypothetical protein